MYGWLDSDPVLALSRFLTAVLPRQAAQAAAAVGGRAAHALLSRPRRALERHGLIGPANLINYARTRADLFYLRRLVGMVEGPDTLPRDAVFVSGHVGNWELGGAWLARRHGLAVLAEAPRTAFARFIDARRADFRIETIHSRAPCWELRRLLQFDGPVAALIDRPAGRIPEGPPAVAWMRGTALVPFWMVITPQGGYRFEHEPPIPAARRRGESRREGTARLARRLTASLERMRRRFADQWFPFFDGPS